MAIYRFLNLILFEIERITHMNLLHATCAQNFQFFYIKYIWLKVLYCSFHRPRQFGNLISWGLGVGFLPFCRVIQEV